MNTIPRLFNSFQELQIHDAQQYSTTETQTKKPNTIKQALSLAALMVGISTGNVTMPTDTKIDQTDTP